MPMEVINKFPCLFYANRYELEFVRATHFENSREVLFHQFSGQSEARLRCLVL